MKLSPNEFFVECTKEFVTVAQKYGLAVKGPVHVPALQKAAEKSVGELLQLKGYIRAYENDPAMYYYHMMSLSFSMGITLAMLWRNAREKFNERNLIEGMVADPATSPHELAYHTMAQFNLPLQILNDLIRDIYQRFLELFKPYAELKDSRDHTLAALYAAFLAGNAVLLDKTEQEETAAAVPAKPEQPEDAKPKAARPKAATRSKAVRAKASKPKEK